MPTIAAGDLVTVVNVFTVAPERQRELVDLLIEATETVISTRPGYVSVNLHASHDGTRVVNYAQWRRLADLEDMLADPAARSFYERATALGATADPHVYQVVYTHGPATDISAQAPQ